MVMLQRGFEDVQPLAERAMAFAVFQLPREATSPTILMVCPTTVVASTLNVTATDVATEQEVVVLVGEPTVVVGGGTPLTGVWLVGNAPVGAVEQVPIAEVAEQNDGTLDAVGSPQEYGTTPARRAAAVKKAAYDQVRSYADSG